MNSVPQATEDAELLRQIAFYAGAINRHHNRNKSQPLLARPRSARPYDRAESASFGRSRSTRNRTLIFSKPVESSSTIDAPTASSWVSSRDRGHMTLTNAATYDASTTAKLSRINETREKKRKDRLMRREAKEAERLKYLASKTLEHAGITYKINKSATLLIRTSLDDLETNPTPSKTLISGVEFLKSPKSNNLFRKSTIKLRTRRASSQKEFRKFCKFFTRSGKHFSVFVDAEVLLIL